MRWQGSPFLFLFLRAMSQVPCTHEYLANAARVKYPAALLCIKIANLPCDQSFHLHGLFHNRLRIVAGKERKTEISYKIEHVAFEKNISTVPIMARIRATYHISIFYNFDRIKHRVTGGEQNESSRSGSQENQWAV